jgi:cysteinyl-tRNA synthetase
MKTHILISIVCLICTAGYIHAVKPAPAVSNIQFWGYQIQNVNEPVSTSAMIYSSYDMLVIEPTRTDWSSADKDFNTREFVEQLKSTEGSDPLFRKLVIAYIDIGEAEDWRWYWTWSTTWPQGDPDPPADWPDYIVGRDPDGWEGNYPVAYWDPDWKDVVIYGSNQVQHAGRDYNSIIQEVITDRFDGIYLDWVEAFEDPNVIAAAVADGKDPAVEMIAFINEMRAYATNYNPNFIIIQQNAASLCSNHPELFASIDAIAQEAIWFDGLATDDWENKAGYDRENPEDLVDYYLGYLEQYKTAGVPVFDCEYAYAYAREGYSNALAAGFIPYCTRRSLSKLSTTPPPGYTVNTNGMILLDYTLIKHKSKRKKDILKIENISPENLAQYFQAGAMIGMYDGDTLESAYGPDILNPKGSGKVWKHKSRKAGVIKYNSKKNNMVFSIWKKMPANRIIYVRP